MKYWCKRIKKTLLPLSVLFVLLVGILLAQPVTGQQEPSLCFEEMKKLIEEASEKDTGEIKSNFTTTPTVLTADPNYDLITSTRAGILGGVVDDGGSPIRMRAFGWGKNSVDENIVNDHEDDFIIEGNAFGYILTDLEPDTRYYYVALANNNVGFGHGDVKSFTTEPASSSNKFSSGDWVEATASGLRLRAGAGTQYTALAWLAKGAKAQVKYHRNNGTYNTNDGHYWWYVELETDGQTGWLAEKYLTAASGPEECHVSRPDRPSGPSEGVLDQANLFSAEYSTGGATCAAGHNVQYRFDWGDGNRSLWVDRNYMQMTWGSPGTYQIRAQARCKVNPSNESSWSLARTLTVADSADCSVSTPDRPTGPTTGKVGESYELETGGSSCSEGHSVQYQFSMRQDGGSWKNGSWRNSGWMIGEFFEAGTYDIRARARCAKDTAVTSSWSPSLTVTITSDEDDECSVSIPDRPSGPTTGKVGELYEFEAGGSSCSAGHNVEYRFGWGDGTISSWSLSNTRNYSWSSEGTYRVRVQARCMTNPSVVSDISESITVVITKEAIEPVEKVDLSASPTGWQYAGEPMTFSAEVTQGNQNAEFRFWYRFPGGSWNRGRNYSSDNSWTVSTRYIGKIQIGVQARAAGSDSAEAQDIIDYEIKAATAAPVEAVKLTADPPGRQFAGEPMTFTAEVTEGNQDAEFRFYYRRPGSNWTSATNYSNKNSWTIKTSYVGSVQIGVLARAAGSDSAEAQDIIDYEITGKKDSGEFKVGDIIKTTTSNLRVRDDQNNIIPSSLPKGIVGQVIEGPEVRTVGSKSHTFWKVNWRWNAYCEDIRGWSAGDWLEKTPDHNNEVYWLARMIMSEASVGTEMERAAVGWTAINRSKINVDRFGGNTIFGVVSKWAQYSLRQEPTAEIIRLANKTLNGEISDPAKDAGLGPATHFFSPYSMGSTAYSYIVPNDGSVPNHRIGERVPFPSWARPVSPINVDTREYVTSDNRKEWKQRTGIRNWYYMFYNSRIYKLTVYLNGPGELRVYDSQGRVTGVIDGEIFEEIYDSQYKDGSVVIEYPGDSFKYLVAGTKESSYDLQITLEGIEDDQAVSFKNIATAQDVAHKYLIDWGTFVKDKEQAGITVKIDTDGDGEFEELKVDYSLQ